MFNFKLYNDDGSNSFWCTLKEAFIPEYHGGKAVEVFNQTVDPVEGEPTGHMEGYMFSGPNYQPHIVKNGVWEKV